MNENTQKIISLYNGERSSKDIANILGLTPRYVRKVAKKFDLERLHCGAQVGEDNHQYVSGRRIDLDGYVLVTAPDFHPSARKRPNRDNWIIREHRFVMEKHLGRYLLPTEVIDHADGLTLHNAPSNLRIFQKNGDHLHETTLGRPKAISVSGRKNISLKNRLGSNLIPVDICYRRRERGDVRLLQILRAALKLGIDSPFLSGTHRHLEKAGIDWSDYSKIEHALTELYWRFEQDLLL